ncbi:MAG: hypothetical protein ACPGVU_03245, partial [Limisphaerales bacterium]
SANNTLLTEMELGETFRRAKAAAKARAQPAALVVNGRREFETSCSDITKVFDRGRLPAAANDCISSSKGVHDKVAVRSGAFRFKFPWSAPARG